MYPCLPPTPFSRSGTLTIQTLIPSREAGNYRSVAVGDVSTARRLGSQLLMRWWGGVGDGGGCDS